MGASSARGDWEGREVRVKCKMAAPWDAKPGQTVYWFADAAGSYTKYEDYQSAIVDDDGMVEVWFESAGELE